jgi:hypothetical protein
MPFTHGLAPYALEDKDIIHVRVQTIRPFLLGRYAGQQTDLWALAPQAQVSRVDFSEHCYIDFLVPPHDWYRGPLYLFTQTRGGGMIGAPGCATRICPGKLYGFAFDQGGSLTGGDEDPPFNPNTNLVLNPILDTWFRIHPGLWYELSS